MRIGNNADIWLNPACPGTFTGAGTIDCTLSGRYLGITIPGQNKILTLCEVEAFENLPYQQLKAVSATQSSSPYGKTGDAKNAINGDKQCSWTYNELTNSLTHTDSQKNAWWNADLGSVKTVQAVTTYNRADCCQERLNGYEVRVGNDPNPLNNPACPGIQNGASNVVCNLQGRYVGVVLTGTNPLTLCEVEIFGF